MAILSTEAISRSAAAVLTAAAPATRKPAVASLGVLDAARRIGASTEPGAAGGDRSNEIDRETLARKIKNLRKKDGTVFSLASSHAQALIQDWFEGASQAAAEFHSQLFEAGEQQVARQALAGNLAWSALSFATSMIPVNPVGLIHQFLKTLTYDPNAPSYAATLEEFRADDLLDRLDAMKDDLTNHGDALVYQALTAIGVGHYPTLTSAGLKALWPYLFSLPVPADGNYILAVKAQVAAALADADQAAADHLAHLAKLWGRSLKVRQYTIDPTHVVTWYEASEQRWRKLTSDPMWFYTGRPADKTGPFDHYPIDPCDNKPQRAALMLRLAVDEVTPRRATARPR